MYEHSILSLISRVPVVQKFWSKTHFKESIDFDDPKEFDDSQVFVDPKEILIESWDFHNPKIYVVTSIFDGLVFI